MNFSFTMEAKLTRTELIARKVQQHFLHKNLLCPKVSIITSLYKGDDFIEAFLKDIVRQTIFNQCELIIINANSPGNEEPIILKYCQKYPNIIYIRLDKDPGLYAVWNYAIKKARGEYITNANVDDARNPFSLEHHAIALDSNPFIDLVYSDFLWSAKPNATFEECLSCARTYSCEFSPQRLTDCYVGPQPMWRKSVHDYAGFFDETFTSSGDWEFWNRIASKGGRFKKIPGLSGVFYMNPQGLSSTQEYTKMTKRNHEDSQVRAIYHKMWQKKPLWSILICTLQERKAKFKRVSTAIQRQIDRLGLQNEVEIRSICDNREMPTGKKRNLLIQQAQGEYVCFVDDDDRVADDYVEMIYQKLLKYPDCVNLIGIVTIDGKWPQKFLHSIKYNNKYCHENDTYYRPPNHLNPIRRSIVMQFPYPDIYVDEDRTFALALAKSKLLKYEERVTKAYYFYDYRSR